VAIGTMLGLNGWVWGWAIVGLAAAWVGVSALTLGRRIGRACAQTTQGLTV
jgi:uncharacterized membrane protein